MKRDVWGYFGWIKQVVCVCVRECGGVGSGSCLFVLQNSIGLKTQLPFCWHPICHSLIGETCDQSFSVCFHYKYLKPTEAGVCGPLPKTGSCHRRSDLLSAGRPLISGHHQPGSRENDKWRLAAKAMFLKSNVIADLLELWIMNTPIDVQAYARTGLSKNIVLAKKKEKKRQTEKGEK